MSYILTLVASENAPPLSEKHVKGAQKIIAHYNIHTTDTLTWLDKNKAAEVGISSKAQYALVEHLRDHFKKDRIDFFITKNENRLKKLLLADMDSTIVTTETLDELADFAGIKEQIAQITARAMNGELDFHNALRERVGLLKGLETKALQETLRATTLSPGAKTLIRTMNINTARCVLVSGGFTIFTERVASLCGFHFHYGNTLGIENEKLNGRVQDPILDKHAKVKYLEHHIEKMNITPQDCLTIGDGANDLPMLKKAGLGIGYHPKETVQKELTNCILYGDLTAALYAQGLRGTSFQRL
ncbi:MAG: phosphoserine phosphatase SerB [Alphaproteobacteria bacterium]